MTSQSKQTKTNNNKKKQKRNKKRKVASAFGVDSSVSGV